MPTKDIIHAVLALLIMLGILGWWMWRSLQRSEDPPRLIAKWAITAVMLALLVLSLSAGAFAIMFALVIGLVLALTWRTSIANTISRPFEILFTGGDTPPDPQPYYSIAQAKRKRGQFNEAVFAIHEQLRKFPYDVTGQVMLAEIQAENLNDLPGAQITIERLCHQPGHAPQNIATALNQLADWHLKFGQDLETARQSLERIIELLPGSEQAQLDRK